MPIKIKSFQAEGMHVSVQKISREEKLLLSGEGNHRSGYLVSCSDSDENRIRLIAAKSFHHCPAAWQVNKVIRDAISSREKMNARSGVEDTLNMLQELGFKPDKDF